MKTQTKTKEERFEKIVEYEEDKATYYGDIFGFIIFSPLIMLVSYFYTLKNYIIENRKVYWRRIK